MNVLSLFDGMSCGRIALERANIRVDRYFSSEIDKYAISVTQKNYPNTVQLGDITKWREWKIDWSSIGLILAGSPCQGFSFAGKQLNFDDPRSKLFFDFVDIFNHVKRLNPNIIFLLENVRMKKEYQDVISEKTGVEPIKINSSLVSAQNRVRLYWTNIPNIVQPDNKYIYLYNIVEDIREYYGAAIRGRYNSDGSTTQKLELNNMRKSNSLTTVKKDTLLVGSAIRNQITKVGIKEFLNIRKDLKSNCVVGAYYKKLNGCTNGDIYRTLTPIECERLQTVPDNYTELGRVKINNSKYTRLQLDILDQRPEWEYKEVKISDSQRYKMLGNGWTVDVIAHIFSFIGQVDK